MRTNTRKREAADLFKSNFYDYGISVIIERALPDIRDGLKPVYRAILFEMLTSKARSTDKPKKVKKITGAVIGNWHPHGDSSVEEALVGMAEPWSNTLPIISIKGNGGSIFGDCAASGRYIEARLTPQGDAYGYNLKEGIVPYVPNFDDTEKMPTILPAQLPYLLINGIKDGIAVGIASNMPPHNAKEVLNMTLAYMKNPKLKTEELLEYMPGPDFPSGATIINKDDLLNIYETGEGKIAVRATLEYDKKEHALHVKEIPFVFAGSMDNLVAELAAATTERTDDKNRKIPPKIPGINAVNNYSGKNGIDICLELQRGIDPNEMTKTLLAKTRLETTVKFIFNAINNRKLNTYSLRRYLREYTEFQHEIVINEHTLEQKTLNEKLEIIMGHLIAISYMDEIIDVVKHSNGLSEVKDVLMHGTILPGTDPVYHEHVKMFAFTERQADSIATMPLYRLNKLNIEKLKKDGQEIQERLRIVNKIITNRQYRHKVIIKRLEQENKKLPDSPRKTRIISDAASTASTKETPTVPLYVQMDRYGYVKITGKTFDDAIPTDNKSRLGFFDQDGNCWNLFLDKTKETKDRGTLISRLIATENPIVGFTSAIEQEGRQGLFIFENGALRRVEMHRYITKNRSTKITTKTADQPLKAFYDIPIDMNVIEINGKTILLDQIPLQTPSGRGKILLSPQEEPYEISFKKEEIPESNERNSKTNDTHNAVVTFTTDGKLIFDWSTTVIGETDGLYTTTYEDLLNQTLVFVHSDGTAKKVKGEGFKTQTKRKQIVADKEGLTAIYIRPDTEETLVGIYSEEKQKRIDTSKIPIQSKLGGGARVFWNQKYQLQEIKSGDGSDLPIVSFATLPK